MTSFTVPSITVIEECCVLAILIYGDITLIALTPRTCSLVALSRDLKNVLEQTDLNRYWSREFYLLPRVLFIGYVSSHMQA